MFKKHLIELESNTIKNYSNLKQLWGKKNKIDIAVERIADLISDGKLLRERKTQLISIAEQLENERKTRLLSVFSHVNKNFSRVYEILQPLGHGSLKLENMKNPSCSPGSHVRA